MSALDYIKSEIKRLYETNPDIHIDIKMSRPRITVNSSAAVIKGIYPSIFRVEAKDGEHSGCYSLQYTDVLVGHVSIAEIDYAPLDTLRQNPKS